MRHRGGQSLIEVIVATGMMALLLVALLPLITISIKNSRLAQNQAQAVSLSQGGVELMRAFRDYSLTALTGSIRTDPYSLPQNWVVEDDLSIDCVPTDYSIDSFFSRCVTVTLAEIDNIEVIVTTYWQEGGQAKNTQQVARLSKWER